MASCVRISSQWSSVLRSSHTDANRIRQVYYSRSSFNCCSTFMSVVFGMILNFVFACRAFGQICWETHTSVKTRACQVTHSRTKNTFTHTHTDRTYVWDSLCCDNELLQVLLVVVCLFCRSTVWIIMASFIYRARTKKTRPNATRSLETERVSCGSFRK